MSTTYHFFTEAKVGDKWVCIDPQVPYMDEDGNLQYALIGTYCNGSRTYFSETFTELVDVATPISMSYSGDNQISSELKTLVGGHVDHGQQLYYISIDDLWRMYHDEKQHRAIVKKDTIIAFEHGDIEDIDNSDTINPFKYSNLAPEAQQLFEYYEWDSSTSINRFLPSIINNLTIHMIDFERINPEAIGYRVVFFAD